MTERESPPGALSRTYRTLVADLPGYAVFLADDEGKVRDWNEGAERTLGLAVEEALGSPVERFYPEDSDRSATDDLALARSEGSARFETWWRRGDEAVIWTTVTIKRLDGAAGGYGLVVRDLTSSREIARAYEESRQRYRSLFEYNTDPVFSLDLDGRIEHANRAALDLLGLAEQDLLGRPLTTLFDAPRSAADTDRLARAAAGEDPIEVRANGPDGAPQELLLRFVDIRLDERGIGAYCIAENVTERRRAARERELLVARERIARGEADIAQRSKSDFLSVMSHELRTPLTAISGFADLLADEVSGPLNDAQMRQVVRIRARSTHLLQMISEILSFARLETGMERVDLRATPLPRLLRTVVGRLGPLLEDCAVPFTTDFAAITPDSPLVGVDGPKIEQILLNLIGNAIKFTREGEIVFRCERADGLIRFEVRDTGIGIDPAQHRKIFEPFWQVEAPDDRTTGGTGLGLSVAHRLAVLMSGALHVDSEPGRGSTFVLEIPALAGDGLPAG